MSDASDLPARETETPAAPAPASPDEPTTAPASPASPSVPEGEPGLMDRLPIWTVPAILVVVPLIVWAAAKIWPVQVFDNFVWPYYWGPIKADAMGRSSLTYHGVAAYSGYNVFNTLTWALLLGLCILGIAQMLRRFKTPMDSRLIIGATSWVVIGSIFHVLEDADLFEPPLQYFFITPPIYLLFGAFGIATFLVGQWLSRIEQRRGLPQALRVLWILHIVVVLVWLGFWLKPWSQINHYVNPVWVALFAAANFLLARHMTLRAGRIVPSGLVLQLSLGAFLLVIAYVVSFLRDPWYPQGDNAMPSAFVWAPALAGAVVGVVWLAGRALTKKRPWAVAYTDPINLLLVFGQMVDAFATSLGIDLAGYEEKQVLSGKVIDGFRDFSVSQGFDFGATYPTFLAFASLKLLVSLAVVYAIDVSSKEDREKHPTLIGLVKFAIIMVGLGPGVRDFTRLSLGV